MDYFLRKRSWEFLILCAIIAVAIFFRLDNLCFTPPGLWVDEAMNGTDDLKVLDSGHPMIFYPDNNGREGLFITLQAISVKMFGPLPQSLRIVSVLTGIATVVGLYLLTRLLLGWEIASIASFLLAVSFWHVNFSRIGFRAIMLPFILVWLFFFLWRGLKKGHISDFTMAGVIAGLGVYTYISYRVAPLIIVILFVNYWWYVKKDFIHAEYTHARNTLLRGFAALFLVAFAIAIPMGIQFITHLGQSTARESQLLVFSQPNPIKELATSVVKTLGMFTFSGDWNPRHNIPGAPELPWPVAIFFAIGFLRELVHWLKQKHGHFSPMHTFLFSWFFVMLLPGFLSTEAPHALRTIGVIPVVMIFAAQGLWWTLSKFGQWYALHEPRYQLNKAAFRHEAEQIKIITIIIFLIAIGFMEYDRYFNQWAKSEATKYAFTSNLADIGNYLNVHAHNYPVYILDNEPGVIVDGVSIFAQPIKYLTETHDTQHQQQKGIFYLTPENVTMFRFPNHFILIPLRYDDQAKLLIKKFSLTSTEYESFTVYTK